MLSHILGNSILNIPHLALWFQFNPNKSYGTNPHNPIFTVSFSSHFPVTGNLFYQTLCNLACVAPAFGG